MARELSNEEKEALLLLDQSAKVGAKTLHKIMHHYSSDISKVLTDSKDNLSRLFSGSPLEGILESRNDRINKKVFQNNNIRTVFHGDSEYPKLLSEIYDFPAILYCRGNIELLNSVSISVVGSRKHTGYAKLALEKIIPGLVNSRVAIVSGLALGVDSIAHHLTLENCGKTIGVLGCGVDEIYPTSNRQLAEKILSTGGLIISEFPLGTPPLKQNFPLRNRIIAGLSSGTLVVEARHDSGSLITAGLANEYGREVFAVPGNIDSFASEGTNELIRQGARIITSADDILSELNISFDISKITIIEPENEVELKIFKAIELESLAVDKIAKSTKLDIVTVNSLMSILEISGKVEKVGDGFRLKGKLSR